MIEVEAKVRLSDPGYFRKRVKRFARFVGKEKKIDDYYTLESLRKYPRKSLRIRAGDRHYVVNFKKWISYAEGIYTKKEFEFRINDLKGFLDLLREFGFKKWLRKEKHCESYNLGGNFNIELNNVKGLGWFAEIEYICDKKDVNFAKKRILSILKKLGVEKEDIVKEGYTKMLWEKRH